jgi:predicted SAM-dependent methyltransferase
LWEWYRVLQVGGLLLVSVPDLRALARLYLDPSLTVQERWMATMMIYGSQASAYDYHKIGFDEQLLHSYLHQAGFCEIQRVASFNLFEDSSEMSYKGYRISLNMRAKKCSTTASDLSAEAVELGINTEPFDRSTPY